MELGHSPSSQSIANILNHLSSILKSSKGCLAEEKKVHFHPQLLHHTLTQASLYLPAHLYPYNILHSHWRSSSYYSSQLSKLRRKYENPVSVAGRSEIEATTWHLHLALDDSRGLRRLALGLRDLKSGRTELDYRLTIWLAISSVYV